jgi:preprotein translocase subunit SecD
MPQVSLEFNDEGKTLFGNITKRSIGKPVAIFLDGSPISTPVVQEAITDGKAVINGKFSIQEAKLLAQRLNAGALPVPINLISQKTVGASLGNESVQQSLKAGIISMVIICLFMIIYYRLPGITASVALLFYGLLVLAIFKVMHVVLTLPGIAGFILSLGMAVDANVLIFERFKEEIRREKPLGIAIDEGFKRAWSSIFDGHVSTLISCLILMGFTTSLVKGFAITLAIGTLISLFSAVFVTRIIVKIITRFRVFNHLWLFGVKLKKQE